ncbi:MAG: hypothetical protein ABJA71_04035 [Ginsengibacter sp.]
MQTPTEYTDEELIVMLKEKSVTSISILYDRYAPAIYGVILRKVENVELAETILQQTFIHIWNNPTFDDRFKKHLLLCLIIIANSIADKEMK